MSEPRTLAIIFEGEITPLLDQERKLILYLEGK